VLADGVDDQLVPVFADVLLFALRLGRRLPLPLGARDVVSLLVNALLHGVGTLAT
jgi:hypothetical protein